MFSISKRSLIKKTFMVLLALIMVFILYVMIVNRNSKDMTARQKILKAVYPAMMWLTKIVGRNTTSKFNSLVSPIVSLYTIPGVLNDGKQLDLRQFKGKKILMVNTASDCGYTDQYESLEKLYQQYKETLVVLGFPANHFKEQEKASDENIAAFCKLNYGVSFPLMKKSRVVKGSDQNELFQWLTHKNKNGWNDRSPSWNFCKYLVDENGKLIGFFAPAVDPMSSEVLKAINK